MTSEKYRVELDGEVVYSGWDKNKWVHYYHVRGAKLYQYGDLVKDNT